MALKRGIRHLLIAILPLLVLLGAPKAWACAFDLDLQDIPACVDELHQSLLIEDWTSSQGPATVTLVDAEDYRHSSRSYFDDALALPEFAGQLLLIDDGHIDLLDVALKVERPDLIDCSGAAHCDLRVPIWVEAGSSLTIDIPAKELRLHSAAGVFFKINGSVMIENTIIRAVETDGVTPSTYVADDVFRPFFSIHGSGNFKARRSAFIDLGYDSVNAQGLSVSIGTDAKDRPVDERPSLTLIDSDVQGLFYGLYTHGAQPVQVIGNRFVRNIRYGIDPHHYSRDLVIAQNIVSGTAVDRPGEMKTAHGIITSVSVNQTLIYDNDVFGNKGSGIVIDENGHDTLVYNNRSHGNANNGLIAYESRDTAFINNVLIGNQRNGAHIRNSPRIVFRDNRIENSGRYGIEAFTSPCGDPTNELQEMTSLIVGVDINQNNDRGTCKLENLGAISLSATSPMDVSDFCGSDPGEIVGDASLAQTLATLEGLQWQSGELNHCE